jgi:DNA recombination protein RmuC
VDLILTSTEKLARRGSRIGELEFEPAPAQAAVTTGSKQAESRTGQLRLRVVDED